MADRKKNRSPQKLPVLSRRELVARLSEAEETLRAIRSGEVDAIVVDARLIPLVDEITEGEPSSVESRLEQLQRMLEALSAIGSTPTPAEDEIAALARAVWEARGCPEGLPEDDWFRAERALKNRRESTTHCLVS